MKISVYTVHQPLFYQKWNLPCSGKLGNHEFHGKNNSFLCIFKIADLVVGVKDCLQKGQYKCPDVIWVDNDKIITDRL